jgi:hypothetical protein
MIVGFWHVQILDIFGDSIDQSHMCCLTSVIP